MSLRWLPLHIVAGLLLVACGGDDLPGGTAPPAANDTVESSIEPVASAVPSGPLIATEVIMYVPPSPGIATIHGRCFASSLAVARPGVWRCISDESGIRDPCFGPEEGVMVVCVRHPLMPDAETMALTGPIPSMGSFPSDAHPWWVLTEDGRLCGFKAGGTAPVVNGLRMNYFCPNDTALLGFPQPGAIWTARQVPAVQTPDLKAAETEIRLRIIWQ